MKIVIASGIYPPDIGGPATYSQLIARELAKRGIKVSLICYSDKKQKDNEEFKIIRILRNNKLARYSLYFLNLFRLAKNCDVIYAQGPLAAGFPAMWVSRILKKKFVIKIVGDYAWEQAVNQFAIKDLIDNFQNKKYNSKIEKIRKIQKRVVSSADVVIVPSEYLKKIVLGWGVDEKRIKVIHNAFIGVKNIVPKELNDEIIISAGRPEPWKGFDVLNEIMPDLLKKNPQFRLIIATNLSHDDLMAHFKASKIFVLNSGYEGFSHIILEAMACGLPVIATNVCGNPEIIRNGYNGLLFEYNNKAQLKNAIFRLWEDTELRKRLVENGYKTLENFTLEKMINRTIEVLK